MDWIIIVDDDSEIRALAASILTREGVRVTGLSSGLELLGYIEGMSLFPDLILLDIEMPGIDGFETLVRFKDKCDPDGEIPVIFFTGINDKEMEIRGLQLGAVDFIRKPFYPEILTLRIKRAIELSHLQKSLSREVAKKSRENSRLTLHVVQTLAETIDAKDTYTNGHSSRVAIYSRLIAGRMGYSEEDQDNIYMMGLLHDVGKIGVPDWIINKTSHLTDEEFLEIKKHPVVGDKILKKITEMPLLACGARWHHERIDGNGYPDGLKGDEIPEQARIIAVADAYDAMTSNRSYRNQLPQDMVRDEIEKGQGTQFDQRIADIMIELIKEDVRYEMREGAAEGSALHQRSEEETIRHMDDMTALPEALLVLTELDTSLGLEYCGEIEDYLLALQIFADSIPSKAAKIKEALDAGDIQNYTTLVHSLKSSARAIGAIDISDLAKELEAAGNAEDIAGIKERTPQLLEKYSALEAPLKALSKD